MIFKEMIRDGLRYGIIKLEQSPNNDGIVCRIGDNWFYFGGSTAEEYDSVEKFRQDIPQNDIIEDIYSAIQEFSQESELKTEYDYYDSYLREKLEKVKYDLLHIPIGQARFSLRRNDDGAYGVMVSASNKAVEVGGNNLRENWDNQIILPILFIQIDKPEQADVWAKVFHDLAARIREECCNNECKSEQTE